MIDLLRRRVRTTFERARPYAVRDVHVQHAALIIERGIPETDDLAVAADRAGVETFFLEKGDDPAQLARKALQVGDDALGVAGRVALLGPVADLASHVGVPVFCAPVGGSNHLARDLRLDVSDPTETLRAMAHTEEILVDYCLANGRPFVNSLAVGRMAALGHEGVAGADRLSAASSGDGGRLRYTTPAGSRNEPTALLVVYNNPTHLAGLPDFGRRMRLDAGVLGVAALASVSDQVTPERPLSAFSSWRMWEVETQLRIESDSPILAVVDGIAVTFTSPLDIISRRKALAMLVPAGTRPGYIPSRQVREAQLSDLAELIAPIG